MKNRIAKALLVITCYIPLTFNSVSYASHSDENVCSNIADDTFVDNTLKLLCKDLVIAKYESTLIIDDLVENQKINNSRVKKYYSRVDKIDVDELFTDVDGLSEKQILVLNNKVRLKFISLKGIAVRLNGVNKINGESPEIKDKILDTISLIDSAIQYSDDLKEYIVNDYQEQEDQEEQEQEQEQEEELPPVDSQEPDQSDNDQEGQ